MAQNYRPSRKSLTPRKYGGKCERCGERKTPNEVYQRVDGNNVAITRNAPYLCADCYLEEYAYEHA